MIVEESAGLTQKELKERLVEVAEITLGPIRREYEHLIQDYTFLENVLEQGSEKAREIAQKNIKEIKLLLGFL